MDESCEQCGKRLAFGIGERVRLPNGTERELCPECAEGATGKGAHATAPSGSSSHGHGGPLAGFATAPVRPARAAPRLGLAWA
jgi:hypothetical protein